MRITHFGMNSKVWDKTTVNKEKLIDSKILPLKHKYPQTCGYKNIKQVKYLAIICHINLGAQQGNFQGKVRLLE